MCTELSILPCISWRDWCAYDDKWPFFKQVDSLKAKLFEKLEQSLEDLQLKPDELTNVLEESNDSSKQENNLETVLANAHDVSGKKVPSLLHITNKFSD